MAYGPIPRLHHQSAPPRDLALAQLLTSLSTTVHGSAISQNLVVAMGYPHRRERVHLYTIPSESHGPLAWTRSPLFIHFYFYVCLYCLFYRCEQEQISRNTHPCTHDW